MSDSPVTSQNVDLSNCDREQIQFAGAVQPHGCMLVVEEPSLRILQASTNAGAILGVAADVVRRGTLEALLGRRLRDFGARLQRERLDNGPVHFACLTADETASKRALNMFAHRASGVLILEFEVIPADAERPMLELYSELRATIAQLQATTSLQAFFDLAVAQIRHFTGFERVMAYKFAEDGSGHVMAESNADGFIPYMGLHYMPVPLTQADAATCAA